MVFATVGNATQRFGRLVDAVDCYAEAATEPVLIQHGTTAPPMFAFGVRAIRPEIFLHLLRMADVVVCHAGAGTLIQCWQLGKLPVVLPREKQYEEHIDDHQVELVRELIKQGLVILAQAAQIQDAIDQSRGQRLIHPGRRLEHLATSRLPVLVRQALEELG